MAGRELTITEAKQGVMERLLLAASWALKKLGRWCFYLPSITVVFPSPAHLQLVHTAHLPPRIQARIIELSSYGIQYAVGESAWGKMSELAKMRGLI